MFGDWPFDSAEWSDSLSTNGLVDDDIKVLALANTAFRNEK